MALFKPNFKFSRITDIGIDFIRENNIKALLLDVDNTLSTHHGTVLVHGLREWLDTMQLNGIKLLILSNSKDKRVAPFAESLGLEYISLALKPLPFGYFKGIKKLGVRRQDIVIVGDQLFTDSLGSNLAGIKSIILDPIEPEPMVSFRIRRYLENKLYKLYKF